MVGVAGVIFSPAFLIYPLLLFLVGNVAMFIVSTLRPKAFPPGPRGLPGLGNLLQVNRAFPFLTYSAWSQIHGNDTIIGLKMGARNVVVMNSGRLVREIFDKRGAVYGDRPWNFMNSTWIFKNDIRAAIFENNSAWLTRWRKEFTNYFGAASLTKFRPIYEAETARLVVKIAEEPTATRKDLEDILVNWIISLPCLGVCGKRPDDLGHGFEIRKYRQNLDEYTSLIAPNARDLLPVLRHLPEVFGMAKWKAKARAARAELLETHKMFMNVAYEQRKALDAGKPIAWESLVSRLLRGRREKGDNMFTTTDMGNTAFHIVSASTNTSLASISVMLMALAKYTEIQSRVRNEVLGVSGGATPKATEVCNWKYTEAFWNECHRWRPVAPQAIAHAPSQDDMYDGYRIPKGTAVLMNVWHIQHSEEDYENPENFEPERFLRHPLGMRPGKALDSASQTDSSTSRVTYDFGAGRRICPGMHSAKQNLLLGLAKVLWAFDILPPEGKDIDLNLETGFVQGIALHPKHLDIRLRLREGYDIKEIMDHYHDTYEGEAKLMGWEGRMYR